MRGKGGEGREEREGRRGQSGEGKEERKGRRGQESRGEERGGEIPVNCTLNVPRPLPLGSCSYNELTVLAICPSQLYAECSQATPTRQL